MWIVNEQALIILGIVVAIAGLVVVSLWVGQQPVELSEVPDTTAVTSMPEAQPGSTQSPTDVPPPQSVSPPVVVQDATEPDIAIGDSADPPAIDGTIAQDEYAHAIEAGGFQVYWSNDQAFLRVGLRSPGTGYMAIGFDPDHRMQGANYILCAMRGGHVVTRDDYGTGPLAHEPDIAHGGRNDVVEAAGTELNGQTTVEFVIPLNSGDPMDKRLEPGNTYKVLVAYHSSSDDFSERHSQRGVGEIRLD